MFLLRRNYAGFSHAAFSGIRKDIFKRNKNVKMITEVKSPVSNKGGRPKKKIKRDEQLAVMCTLVERKAIEHKAKAANISISEYLRSLGVKGQVDRKIKVFPKEVLQFNGTLNHMAANLNQIAKKRNREETFNGMEREEFIMLSEDIQELVKQIRNYLQ